MTNVYLFIIGCILCSIWYEINPMDFGSVMFFTFLILVYGFEIIISIIDRNE